MTSRSVSVLGVIAVAATLGGCSGESAETPPAATFPPRPAVVQLDRFSECDLLSDIQQQDLKLTRITSGTLQVEGIPARTCTFLGDAGVDINVQVIPLDAAVARRLPSASTTQVNGFGAVVNVPADRFGDGPICQVAVDAAPGQSIRVQALTRTDPPPVPIDQVCQRATETASMVMTTVIAIATP